MGFMVGPLNKVWPWKETVETYLDSHGVAQPLVQNNIAPGTFEQLTGATLAARAGYSCSALWDFWSFTASSLVARMIVQKQEE